MDLPLGDQAVRLPRLAVVREVRADDVLQVHPQVTVVVLMHEPARRRAGDDRAALARHEDARAEGLLAGVLEHDVRVLATGQLADARAETLPLLGVLVVLVLPEPVALRVAVDDQLRAHLAADLRLLRARHHTDRRRAAVQRELRRVRAETAGRTPDEDG